MRAVVATAQNQDAVIDLYYAIIEEVESKGNFVTFSEVRDLQITVVYEVVATQSEVNQPKARKQPTVKSLNAKAEKLCLFTIAVEKANGQYQIVNNYGKNEVIYSCKTATGISRKLTAIYWDKQINNLKNHGLIKA